MKTTEELNIIKEEIEMLNGKLAELTDEELEQVTGGYNEYSRFLICEQILDDCSVKQKIAGMGMNKNDQILGSDQTVRIKTSYSLNEE